MNVNSSGRAQAALVADLEGNCQLQAQVVVPLAVSKEGRLHVQYALNHRAAAMPLCPNALVRHMQLE